MCEGSEGRARGKESEDSGESGANRTSLRLDRIIVKMTLAHCKNVHRIKHKNFNTKYFQTNLDLFVSKVCWLWKI